MFTNSIWNSLSETTHYPSLTKNIKVDVAIIGGGITGITTALLLKQRGYDVAVLEARKIGKGTTGHSTGNLYVIIDQLLSPIKSKYDQEVVKKVVQSRGEAFRLISDNIKKYNIDCDFKIQPMYIYEDEKSSKVNNELQISREAKIPVSEISIADFPFKYKKGMVLQGQATFNPLLYIQGLAKQLNGENAAIYENTKVTKIEEGSNEVLLTAGSSKVVAKYVLHATHTPKGIEVQYHTVLGPYREYGVAVKIEDDNYPDGIYWGYYENQKYSIRTYTRNGENFLLCIGMPHKVGQAEDNEEHINNLINFIKRKYKVLEITHRWGGQHYKPADFLPYIGRKNKDSKQLVATGFSTDGLIYGTLSGILISDLIDGRNNIYSDIYKASRHQPIKAAAEFIKENLDVAKVFIEDRLKQEETEVQEIKPGEAKIMQLNGEKAAVFRNNDGALTYNSAICTHLGCVVHWNNAEKTWDCPCHGSRFDTAGEVIEGPAIRALKKIEDKKQTKS